MSNFLIGAATAAYQVEGNNIHSDTWYMERMKYGGYKELSLDAADHYHTYREDIRKMRDAGLNAYRFSIEWGRIEPEEKVFDQKEMEHYLDMIHACREYGIEPMVTLLHFTVPKWLISKGGWEADTTVDDFARYVNYVCGYLKDENLKYICTINEANMGTLIAGYLAKAMENVNAGQLQIGMNLEAEKEEEERIAECMEVFGMEQANTFASPRSAHGNEIIMNCHRKAVEIIHETLPGVKAGMSLSLCDLQAEEGGEAFVAKEWKRIFMDFLPAFEHDDFFGVQSYTRNVFGKDGEILPDETVETTQMHYEYYPECIGHVIRKVAEFFKGDLIVTENGIATDDDERRCAYIETAMESVQSCVKDGLPVKGYFYWSLIDNYEWQTGYEMQFGLMSIDHQERRSMKLLGSYTE